MSRLVIAALTAALALSTLPAGAAMSNSPAWLKPVDAVFSGINTNNSAAVAAAYSSDAVIVDEFAPFQWSGAAAAKTWWADFGAFAAKAKLSGFHATHGKPAFLSYNDAKTSAYAVMPATITYLFKGKKQTEIGRWAYVVTKTADGWLIASSAWATVSDTGR